MKAGTGEIVSNEFSEKEYDDCDETQYMNYKIAISQEKKLAYVQKTENDSLKCLKVI